MRSAVPNNPQTQALLEKALQHVLAEQAKVFKHKRGAELLGPAQRLGELSLKTWELMSQGFHKIRDTSHLTGLARQIEREIDDISEAGWFHIDVSVSGIYERVEESFELRLIDEELKLKAAITVRNHFHNVRLLLLEQLLSARMLINNSDYGSELQRVWQQFLQRELGPDFRVLEGGHIIDHAGDNANAQIDLIVVANDAQVLTPSHLEDGKVNVLCDEVIAAIMVTSNLTAQKFAEDWQKLERVSNLFRFTDEFPKGRPQAWPLCYIVAGQAEPLTNLTKSWEKQVARDSASSFVPQFVIALDSGYLFSGATSWLRPRYPSNYVNRDEIISKEGIFAGLGLAWLLTQIRARLKLMHDRPCRSIIRFTKLLDDAAMEDGLPATWSPRFHTFGTMQPIKGVLHWGHTRFWPHNRLCLYPLKRCKPELQFSRDFHVFRCGVNTSKLTLDQEFKSLRWFRFDLHWSVENLVAFEEWTRSDDGSHYTKSYAVFDAQTGDEVPLHEPFEGRGYKSVEDALRALLAFRSSSIHQEGRMESPRGKQIETGLVPMGDSDRKASRSSTEDAN